MKYFIPIKEVPSINNINDNLNTEITMGSQIKYRIINYIKRLTQKIVKVFKYNYMNDFQFTSKSAN